MTWQHDNPFIASVYAKRIDQRSVGGVSEPVWLALFFGAFMVIGVIALDAPRARFGQSYPPLMALGLWFVAICYPFGHVTHYIAKMRRREEFLQTVYLSGASAEELFKPMAWHAARDTCIVVFGGIVALIASPPYLFSYDAALDSDISLLLPALIAVHLAFPLIAWSAAAMACWAHTFPPNFQFLGKLIALFALFGGAVLPSCLMYATIPTYRWSWSPRYYVMDWEELVGFVGFHFLTYATLWIAAWAMTEAVSVGNRFWKNNLADSPIAVAAPTPEDRPTECPFIISAYARRANSWRGTWFNDTFVRGLVWGTGFGFIGGSLSYASSGAAIWGALSLSPILFLVSTLYPPQIVNRLYDTLSAREDFLPTLYLAQVKGTAVLKWLNRQARRRTLMLLFGMAVGTSIVPLMMYMVLPVVSIPPAPQAPLPASPGYVPPTPFEMFVQVANMIANGFVFFLMIGILCASLSAMTLPFISPKSYFRSLAAVLPLPAMMAFLYFAFPSMMMIAADIAELMVGRNRYGLQFAIAGWLVVLPFGLFAQILEWWIARPATGARYWRCILHSWENAPPTRDE